MAPNMKAEQQEGASNVQAAQKRRTVLDRHLWKTKQCVYYQRGACKHGSKCGFAHGGDELHESPTLFKTRICPDLETCKDPDCKYAHSQNELRSTDFCYKTTMCIWYSVGKCRNATNCRFAHGKEELRGIPAEQEMQEKLQAGKGVKTGKAANKDERKPKEGNAAPDGGSAAATKSSKTKARAARRAAGKASTEAPSTQEEDLAPVQEEGNFQSLFSDEFANDFVNEYQPMFVHTGAHNPRFELPPQVHHDLLEKSGFLAPLRNSEEPTTKGIESEIVPPPGLPRSFESSSPMDFNIIPDYRQSSNELQKVSHGYNIQNGPQRSQNGEITKLAESIKSLSEQLTTLQQCIVHQSETGIQRRQPKTGKVVGRGHNSGHSQGHSESTKSGSDYNGSSPPSTPGSEKHKNRTKDQLSQLTEFSRELNWALGSQMNLMEQLGGNPGGFMTTQLPKRQLPQQQLGQQWFAQL
eukprot:gnl/MRDRNA2_/MRDRNA2_148740_c0_seq1.p1 gnl/MRDRNA2_/MRDRNA2_148740_c0~~gnl/MRDRNA2_/MRDRNA2_148740_c0_seq1.p1  ORF type:complete len:467 (+),score=105.70 gnl/MRDRNA2_/MRDRNA2_148740_c0_seq1:70-1470(+)